MKIKLIIILIIAAIAAITTVVLCNIWDERTVLLNYAPLSYWTYSQAGSTNPATSAIMDIWRVQYMRTIYASFKVKYLCEAESVTFRIVCFRKDATDSEGGTLVIDKTITSATWPDNTYDITIKESCYAIALGAKINELDTFGPGDKNDQEELPGQPTNLKGRYADDVLDDCTTPSGLTNNTAEDISTCEDGIDVGWTIGVDDWGDATFRNRSRDIDEVATRTYDVYRGASAIRTGIAYGSTNYIDTTATNGVPYLYRVRYNNACGLSALTTGDTATDYDYNTLVDAKLIIHTM